MDGSTRGLAQTRFGMPHKAPVVSFIIEEKKKSWEVILAV